MVILNSLFLVYFPYKYHIDPTESPPAAPTSLFENHDISPLLRSRLTGFAFIC